MLKIYLSYFTISSLSLFVFSINPKIRKKDQDQTCTLRRSDTEPPHWCPAGWQLSRRRLSPRHKPGQTSKPFRKPCDKPCRSNEPGTGSGSWHRPGCTWKTSGLGSRINFGNKCKIQDEGMRIDDKSRGSSIILTAKLSSVDYPDQATHQDTTNSDNVVDCQDNR